jgi:hypothetical protein
LEKNPMNVTRMTDEELMSFEPASALQAQAVAAELRRRSQAQFQEADQLERWGRSLLDDAIQQAWDEPDPNLVTLQDGRKVARKFYDPLLHGKPAD